MIFRSKAPLRLGLAGGGTDVSPFCDEYGGMVLNATINMFAYCTLEVTQNSQVEFVAADIGSSLTVPTGHVMEYDGVLDLHKGVYNRIVRDYNDNKPLSLKITTYSDAPAGSGLGSSSTMVVAMIKTYVEWLNLPLGEYDVAHLAYEIERLDVGLNGGKQDQYAATFGGFNFMEFYAGDKVIVNPLRIKKWFINELESSMVLYYTGASRDSARIIDEQAKNASAKNVASVEAMHEVKADATAMKEALLKCDIHSFATILGKTWEAKKRMASTISNPMIDKVYDVAMSSGAISGKISGAGGGGFMMFITDPTQKLAVVNALNKMDGAVRNFQFVKDGTMGWRI